MPNHGTEILKAVIPLERQPKDVKVTLADMGPALGGVTYFDKQSRPTAVVVPHTEELSFPEKATTAQKREIQLEHDTTRVVRMHELLHAKHSDLRWSKKAMFLPETKSAYEDIRVQGVHWRDNLPPRCDLSQAAVRVAEHDLGQITVSEMATATPQQWNHAVIQAARSIATIEALRGGITGDEVHSLSKVFGDEGVHTLINVVRRARRTGITASQRTEILANIESFMMATEKPKSWQQHKVKGSDGAWTGADTEMMVYDPPKHDPCDQKPARVRIRRPYGSRLNFGKLPSYMVDYDSSKLFVTNKLLEGFRGTIVVDASGSMGADPIRLQKLCKALPGAIIAYYSDDTNYRKHIGASRTCGTLVVYARNGKRISDKEGMPYHGDGNAVDAAAIEWMLEQPGPHILVTDCGFCGGLAGNQPRAIALLQMNPKIRVVNSISDAWVELCGQPEPE